jgi:hypothetical protein
MPQRLYPLVECVEPLKAPSAGDLRADALKRVGGFSDVVGGVFERSAGLKL